MLYSRHDVWEVDDPTSYIAKYDWQVLLDMDMQQGHHLTFEWRHMTPQFDGAKVLYCIGIITVQQP